MAFRQAGGAAIARKTVANVVLAGVVALGAGLTWSATALADPPADGPAAPADPAADPGPVGPPPPGPYVPVIGAPLAPNGFSVLAQNGQPAAPGELGVPQNVDLTPGSLLGQAAVPSAPGAPVATSPSLNSFNNGNLLQQNEVPSAPGKGTEVGVAPGDENKDLGRIDFVRHYLDLLHNGNLKGGLLGRVPKTQLGEPLPGTAPPPGTNIPPGLGEYLPDPADAPPPPGAPGVPGVPPAPGVLPPPGVPPVPPVDPGIPAPPPPG